MSHRNIFEMLQSNRITTEGRFNGPYLPFRRAIIIAHNLLITRLHPKNISINRRIRSNTSSVGKWYLKLKKFHFDRWDNKNFVYGCLNFRCRKSDNSARLGLTRVQSVYCMSVTTYYAPKMLSFYRWSLLVFCSVVAFLQIILQLQNSGHDICNWKNKKKINPWPRKHLDNFHLHLSAVLDRVFGITVKLEQRRCFIYRSCDLAIIQCLEINSYVPSTPIN